MRGTGTCTAGILLLCAIAGCNEQFSPDGPYSKKLVVYGVLQGGSSVQFVRVYSTYPPMSDPAYLPGDNQVTDAVVTVSLGNTVYPFRDTTVVRADKSRFQSDIHAYVAYNFPLLEAATYTLQVKSPSYGSASASATTLYPAYINVDNPQTILHPDNAANITVVITPGITTAAYVMRFVLDFKIVSATDSSLQRAEVPSALQTPQGGSGPYVFPKPMPKGSGIPGLNPGDELYQFATAAYRQFLTDIAALHGGAAVVPMKATFSITQMDGSLFTYYNVANGFPEATSIRLDEPDYSNIVSGLGVFAAVKTDSTQVVINLLAAAGRGEQERRATTDR